jgi:hypothetical protein
MPEMRAADIFWVTTQDDQHRAKHAFIKRNSHRLRKEKRLHELQNSMQPFPPKRLPSLVLTSTELVDEHGYQESRGLFIAPAVSRAFDPGFLDSFSSLAAPMTRKMNHYFHYCKFRFILLFWPLAHPELDKTSFCKSSYPFNSTEMATWWWQKALDQPALIYILLATSSRHRASIGLGPASTEMDQHSLCHSLQFRNQTIKLLRQTILETSRANLELVILVIINLICVEVSGLFIRVIRILLSSIKTTVTNS